MNKVEPAKSGEHMVNAGLSSALEYRQDETTRNEMTIDKQNQDTTVTSPPGAL